jgi:hypothetical protein
MSSLLEIAEYASHTADHPAAREKVRAHRQVTVVGDATNDVAVWAAQAECVVDDDDAGPGSLTGWNLQYRLQRSVGGLKADVGHCAPRVSAAVSPEIAEMVRFSTEVTSSWSVHVGSRRSPSTDDESPLQQ